MLSLLVSKIIILLVSTIINYYKKLIGDIVIRDNTSDWKSDDVYCMQYQILDFRVWPRNQPYALDLCLKT